MTKTTAMGYAAIADEATRTPAPYGATPPRTQSRHDRISACRPVRRSRARPEAEATYRASADCTRGRVTPVDGQTCTFAGVWDASDIGTGRTRWRDASGKIVGRDNASGGLAISQQWELLCPGIVKPAQAAAPAAPKASAGTPAPAAASAAAFVAGQAIEAKYGRDWIRGQVLKVRRVAGSNGPAFEYDVLLDNGKRGIVPANMVRRVGP
jgi:hypothetical protein